MMAPNMNTIRSPKCLNPVRLRPPPELIGNGSHKLHGYSTRQPFNIPRFIPWYHLLKPVSTPKPSLNITFWSSCRHLAINFILYIQLGQRPISGLLTSVRKSFREVLILEEPTRIVAKIIVNSRCNRVFKKIRHKIQNKSPKLSIIDAIIDISVASNFTTRQ